MDGDAPAPLGAWLREACLHAVFWASFVQARVVSAGTHLFACGGSSLAEASRAIAGLRALSHDMRILKGVVGSIALVRWGGVVWSGAGWSGGRDDVSRV